MNKSVNRNYLVANELIQELVYNYHAEDDSKIINNLFLKGASLLEIKKSIDLLNRLFRGRRPTMRLTKELISTKQNLLFNKACEKNVV